MWVTAKCGTKLNTSNIDWVKTVETYPDLPRPPRPPRPAFGDNHYESRMAAHEHKLAIWETLKMLAIPVFVYKAYCGNETFVLEKDPTLSEDI